MASADAWLGWFDHLHPATQVALVTGVTVIVAVAIHTLGKD